jgi:hypothetical protein
MEHRRQWHCPSCDGVFETRISTENHLATDHPSISTSLCGDLIDAASQHVQIVEDPQCLFCDDTEPWDQSTERTPKLGTHAHASTDLLVSTNSFQRHVGRHLEQIALFAVSSTVQDTEPDEVDSTASRGTQRNTDTSSHVDSLALERGREDYVGDCSFGDGIANREMLGSDADNPASSLSTLSQRVTDVAAGESSATPAAPTSPRDVPSRHKEQEEMFTHATSASEDESSMDTQTYRMYRFSALESVEERLSGEQTPPKNAADVGSPIRYERPGFEPHALSAWPTSTISGDPPPPQNENSTPSLGSANRSPSELRALISRLAALEAHAGSRSPDHSPAKPSNTPPPATVGTCIRQRLHSQLPQPSYPNEKPPVSPAGEPSESESPSYGHVQANLLLERSESHKGKEQISNEHTEVMGKVDPLDILIDTKERALSSDLDIQRHRLKNDGPTTSDDKITARRNFLSTKLTPDLLRDQEDLEALEKRQLDRAAERAQYRTSFDPLHRSPDTIHPARSTADGSWARNTSPPAPPSHPHPAQTRTRFASSSPPPSRDTERQRRRS